MIECHWEQTDGGWFAVFTMPDGTTDRVFVKERTATFLELLTR